MKSQSFIRISCFYGRFQDNRKKKPQAHESREKPNTVVAVGHRRQDRDHAYSIDWVAAFPSPFCGEISKAQDFPPV